MKKIEDVKWYHTSNYHQKHLTVNFMGGKLELRNKQSDDEFKFV